MNGFHRVIDFADASGHGDVCVVAEARLDNRRELIEALSTSLLGEERPSDTELILAAYLQWGERCPERLLGDFAFSIWDPRNRRLFCARDPLGVRQLYYTQAGSRLGVASEIGALLNDRRIDLTAVGDYLARIASEPERTFFEDVHRLPGGHILIATPEGLTVRRYWDVSGLPTLPLGEDEAANRFLELLDLAVRDRLETTPGGSVGIAMSGGLDSTSVAAIADRELARSGGGSLRAYSFVFNQIEKCDERVFISVLSKTLGIETSFIEAEKFWFLGEEESYAPPLETPEMSWDSAFRQMLRSLREKGSRVLLTGHGADDLLRGSNLACAERLRRGDLRVVREVWKYSRSGRYGWRPFYHLLVEPLLGADTASGLRRLFRREPLGLPAWVAPEFVRRTRLAERLAETAARPALGNAHGEMYRHLVTRPAYHRSIGWYDRHARSFGIEVRHPFLDRRLFEFVFALPPEHLSRLGERKPILRRALAGILPDAVRLRRTKTNLGSFVDFSLKKEADRIRKLLAAPLSADCGIIDGKTAREAFERYCVGETAPGQRSLWYVITLELWLRQHQDRFSGALVSSDFAREAA